MTTAIAPAASHRTLTGATASNQLPTPATPRWGPGYRPAEYDETSRRLLQLGRRHGTRTTAQRIRLRDSVVRHINAGNVDLPIANAYLAAHGIAPAAGPAVVTVRLPFAVTVVHEDAETDADMFDLLVEEVVHRMWYTTYLGCPDGHGIAPHDTEDPWDRHRHAVVYGDLRLRVTVPAYAEPHQPATITAAALAEDLRCFNDDDRDVEILTEPIPWSAAPDGPVWREHAPDATAWPDPAEVEPADLDPTDRLAD
jgi:hypothetical protein